MTKDLRDAMILILFLFVVGLFFLAWDLFCKALFRFIFL